MAVAPYVSGPVLVKVNLRDGAGVVNLGYTADGVEWQMIPKYRDIYSDRAGGTEGSPIVKQFLSAEARIPLQLVEFEPIVLRKMMHIIVNNGAAAASGRIAGELPQGGCLSGLTTSSFQVILVGACDATALAADAPAGTGSTYDADGAQVLTPVNFLNCFYEGPMTFPVGSRNSMPSFDILALPTTSDTTNNPAGDGKTRIFIPRNSTAYANLAAVSAP
jgi:hypothetical protein